jgi:hypothetical protein
VIEQSREILESAWLDFEFRIPDAKLHVEVVHWCIVNGVQRGLLIWSFAYS